ADTQVMVTLHSAGDDVMPEPLAALAASAALMVSDIPFAGPISEVRVGRVEGEFVINPSQTQLAASDIDMTIAASEENILMVEGEMEQVSELEMLEAIKVAHEAIKVQCKAQKELEKLAGTTEKREYSHEENDEALKNRIFAELKDQVLAAARLKNPSKDERKKSFGAIIDAFIEALPEDTEEITISLAKKYYHDLEKEAIREMVLEDRKRLDGRDLNQVRPIWSEVGYLPKAHGSAVFTRGETQSLTSLTLGTKLNEQMIDGAVYSGTSPFILHYNFPGFSTGEVRPNRGPGRREVGHGNLAHRALKKVIPFDKYDSYTIRLISDILESNGSSSMATVCAGTLALMDGGIQIDAPVSGIAMGLISDSKTGKYAVLSDILGDEDHLGDMDFKVTGTTKGITACQMDIKVDGLPYQILEEALLQAKEGRLHILDEMLKTINAPNDDFKDSAPRCVDVIINGDKIGAVIGPGGKNIQELQKSTGTTVMVRETPEGKGKVNIFASDKAALEAARERIVNMTTDPEIGETYDGTVKSILPFGAVIEFMPGKEGLLHISEIKWERIENVEDIMEVGEVLKIKLLDIDKRSGKFKLSRKVLLPKPETAK
ncbi:MAG: polyribonucleotide nucleotidyltransferase, partial [Cyclobacteriaceae bacterium]